MSSPVMLIGQSVSVLLLSLVIGSDDSPLLLLTINTSVQFNTWFHFQNQQMQKWKRMEKMETM